MNVQHMISICSFLYSNEQSNFSARLNPVKIVYLIRLKLAANDNRLLTMLTL